MADPLSIVGSVVSILGGVQSLFAKPPKPPKIPEPVDVAPVPDDQAIAANARRTAARRSQSSGAVSTVLTDRLGA